MPNDIPNTWDASLFSGLRVIDCTRVFSGPYATRYFADYGAEVIKIENDRFHDESRYFSPVKNGWSGYFEILNRGKKSVSLDLSTQAGKAGLYELIQHADVFVENFSPTVKYSLGIDYDTLSAINPRLVYASLNGYGEETDGKAYDVIIQAESGLASLNGETHPMKNATSIIDTFSGTALALGIASLLYKREKTGKGDFVNVPMIAGGLQLTEQNIVESSITGKNPPLPGNQDNAIFPFGFFPASDADVSLAIGNDTVWEGFVSRFLPGLPRGPYATNVHRVEQRKSLESTIAEAFSHWKADDLVAELRGIGIPAARIRTMTDLLADQALYAQGYLAKTEHSRLGECVVPYQFLKYRSYPAEAVRPAPEIGADTFEFFPPEHA